MWDGVSLIVGLLVGMVIAIIVFWILYQTRVFIYTKCPSVTPPCLYDQYWNDPGNALAAQNPNRPITLSNILSIQNGEMRYRRVPKSSSCVPESETQTVTITNPQYCTFTTTEGKTFNAKNAYFESPVYTGKTTFGGQDVVISVITKGNCEYLRSEVTPCATPGSCDVVKSGAQTNPVMWDPNTRITEGLNRQGIAPTLGI